MLYDEIDEAARELESEGTVIILPPGVSPDSLAVFSSVEGQE